MVWPEVSSYTTADQSQQAHRRPNCLNSKRTPRWLLQFLLHSVCPNKLIFLRCHSLRWIQYHICMYTRKYNNNHIPEHWPLHIFKLSRVCLSSVARCVEWKSSSTATWHPSITVGLRQYYSRFASSERTISGGSGIVAVPSRELNITWRRRRRRRQRRR